MIEYGKVFYATGTVLFILAGITAIPAAVDLCLAQSSGLSFIVSAIFCCFIAGLMFLPNRTHKAVFLTPKEKILAVLLSWIAVPIMSALPFISSFGGNLSISDCIFEVVSALTTTGATCIRNTEKLSSGLLLWRSMLQLFGGIGFTVSCCCVFSDFIAPGSEKDGSGLKNASLSHQLKTLVSLYLAAIVIGSFLLTGSGVPPTEALCCALDAISSGGILISDINFSARSGMILPILSLLMFMGGISFISAGNSGIKGFSVFGERQFVCYAVLTGIGILVLSVCMLLFSETSFSESLKTAAAAVISSLTTTGMAVRLPESFSSFADSCLYVSNFCGGCYGSCTGGIKIFRLMMMFYLVKSYLIRLVKTNAVFIPICEGKKINEIDVTGLLSYFTCYLTFALVMSLGLTLVSDFDFGKAFGAVMTSVNNNGPFFGLHRATAAEISELSEFAKAAFVVSMAAGRIEFISFLMILIRPFWKK
ncbi:MAG: hypothetical protein LBO73_04605 [Holosporaceae bacterium]|nr:hypothetical protein [Holosporaceae bacterium]